MNFQHIGIVGKTEDKALQTINRLVEYLNGKQLNVAIEESTAAKMLETGKPAYELDELCQRSDLIIVVGGDGTLLGTARIAVTHEVPVLGINLGRLGFLVDISPDDMCESLDKVLSGFYEIDDRILRRKKC